MFCKRWNKHVFLLTYYFKDYVLSPCMMKSISYKCDCIMEFLVHFGKHFVSSFLTSCLFPLSQELSDIIPRDTLLWKLKLLKAGAAYANSRLHAVQAEVLLLARSVTIVSAIYTP